MKAGALYDCRVMHRRPGPPRYRFVHRLYYLLLDLERIDVACAQSRLLSRNRFNLFSFYDREHGPRDGSGLAAWARGVLADFNVELGGGRILLLCLPRVLGYGFNPISLYYAYHADGRLRAVIAQVHNTFGEQHCYVVHGEGAPLDLAAAHDKDKRFHVSPLLAREGFYRFRLNEPGARLQVGIRLLAADGAQRLGTALSGRRRALTTRNLLGLFLRIPLMSLKVTLAIHWQALKIWLRRAPLVRKPRQHADRIS